jgi:uncharacterized protein YlxW (UPF0749 family)
MSTRYSSSSGSDSTFGVAATEAPPHRATRRNNWLLSLTGICFVFGGALAMQLRSVQSAQEVKDKQVVKAREAAGVLVVQQRQSEQLRQLAARSAQENQKSRQMIATLRAELSKSGELSVQQVKALNIQLSLLQMASGVTAVSGPGIRITMDDNASTPQNADASSFLPGIVHDFDLLQTVNELRLANAEAISIKGAGQTEGTRVTAYTPIRCVGPMIQVEGQPITTPFTIEAIGNPQALDKAVNMAGGILSNLKDESRGPALQIKTEQIDKLTLPAASSGAPRFRLAKPAS